MVASGTATAVLSYTEAGTACQAGMDARPIVGATPFHLLVNSKTVRIGHTKRISPGLMADESPCLEKHN
jgi:hypothetical protein